MGGNLIFGVSLTASFLAGVLALFAPCCITFLFPSYLGTIFKEQKKVMLYTFLFALGIGFVLVPIAMGFKFFVMFFDDFHRQVYYVGALALILMGIFTIKPFFHLPQLFTVNPKIDKSANAASVFGLGIMSGLTSACCAPVLFAAVTLTSLTPTLIQALFVSMAYVFGIVFPLFLLSLSYEKFSAKISGKNRKKTYDIFKWLGAGIFIVSGLLIAVFNYLGLIRQNQMKGYSQTMQTMVFNIARYFQNPIVDLLVFGGIILVFAWLVRIWKKPKV